MSIIASLARITCDVSGNTIVNAADEDEDDDFDVQQTTKDVNRER